MAFAENQGVPIAFDDVGAGPPVVLGHSFLCSGRMWGGQVPVLAANYRVLNVDFRGHGRSGEVLGARLLGIGPFLSPIARLMFGATTRQQNPRLVRGWKSELSAVHVPSVLRCLDALMQRDSLLARLPQIGVPTLVLVGEDDRSLPPCRARRIHGLVPDSKLVQIPAAGHLSALDAAGSRDTGDSGLPCDEDQCGCRCLAWKEPV